MNTTMVSVIIPHLNQPDQLQKCLQSLSEQTYDMSEVEIIVVDNGSKQLPDSICRQFTNVRLLQEPTPGPGPARNKGIAAARSDILAFIDADCIADKNWLQAINAAFENPDIHVIGGDVRIAYQNPARLTALEAYESVFAFRQKEYIEKMGFSGTGNMAARMSSLRTVGQFGGISVAEDRDWGIRAKNRNVKIVYIPDMIVEHPARQTFNELKAKWDRHLSHDFDDRPPGIIGRFQLIFHAALLAASSIVHAGKVFRSHRLNTLRSRLSACFILMKIRMYRAYMVARLAFGVEEVGKSRSWNRK